MSEKSGTQNIHSSLLSKQGVKYPIMKVFCHCSIFECLGLHAIVLKPETTDIVPMINFRVHGGAIRGFWSNYDSRESDRISREKVLGLLRCFYATIPPETIFYIIFITVEFTPNSDF